MKNSILVFGIIFVVVGLFVYTLLNAQGPRNNTGKKKVLTTFTVLADMARNVAGDKLEVESLTKIGAEIHGYEATPQDLIRAQSADLILDNGFNLEKWAEKLYNSIPSVPHVTLTENIEPIGIAEGPYQDKPNPHAWMSPSNALVYVENIKKAFIDLDPANADTYTRNADAYKKEIEKLDLTLTSELSSLPANKRYLVSCEGAFTYLIRDYNLRELYLWPINADTQGTPQQIRHVIEEVRRNNIPVVFCESTVNNKAQLQVVRETNAKFGGAFYVDSLSEANGPTATYLEMLRFNTTNLINGLK